MEKGMPLESEGRAQKLMRELVEQGKVSIVKNLGLGKENVKPIGLKPSGPCSEEDEKNWEWSPRIGGQGGRRIPKRPKFKGR